MRSYSVSQCDAHTFFLIHEGPQNLESQGVIIGTLATNYLLTAAYDLATKTRNALPDDPKPAELLRPEYPEFGYHFCGNLDRDNLQKDVLIAANRMVAHLERCREGKLRELTADNDVTMSDLEQTPLVLGRKLLSRLQEAMLRGWIDDGAGPRKPAFDAAKEYVEQQEMDASRRPPSDRQLDYFRRAEEILERSRPGPDEVSSYMGPFALQAAAIEEIIHGAIRKVRPQYDFRPAIVIGTVIYSNLVEPWIVISTHGCEVLVQDANFVEFLYQLTKVSVCSSKATEVQQADRTGVQLDFAPVDEQIRSRPELADGLLRCIRRYIAEGRPDSSTASSPALEYQQTLGHLCAHGRALSPGAWLFTDNPRLCRLAHPRPGPRLRPGASYTRTAPDAARSPGAGLLRAQPLVHRSRRPASGRRGMLLCAVCHLSPKANAPDVGSKLA